MDVKPEQPFPLDGFETNAPANAGPKLDLPGKPLPTDSATAEPQATVKLQSATRPAPILPILEDFSKPKPASAESKPAAPEPKATSAESKPAGSDTSTATTPNHTATTSLQGLSSAEVAERVQQGLLNHPVAAPTRSIRQIVRDNIITPFNILNFVLAGLVIFASLSDVKLLRNLTFMGVVFSNTIIGIIQEIRAKQTIDKLSILTEPKVTVIRNGTEQVISVHELVIGDLMKLESGNQISVDAKMLQGVGFEVDESLLTGESDNIIKHEGDELYSGSVVMAGTAYAVVEQVSENTVAAKIALEAKRETRKSSHIMDSLDKIIKVLSLFMIPIGIALFLSSYAKAADGSLPTVIVTVVAALIGMVPEGLMLLTSAAFAVGVINLGRKHMLVQTLPSIETLARVDTICLDKTGTLTNGQMDVNELHIFNPQAPTKFLQKEEDIGQFAVLEQALSRRIAALVAAQSVSNATQDAVAEHFTDSAGETVVKTVPFSSKRKWSGVQFASGETLIMGAPEFVLGDAFHTIAPAVNDLAGKGYRILLLASSAEGFPGEGMLPPNLKPAACISLVDQLRENVQQTLSYFHEQGVTVKVISGDNPRTVSAVAKNAGVQNFEKWIDMSQVEAGTDLSHLVETYTLFGRVTPFQKRELLNALQGNGHVVSMTGDGVNDVLALKDADCSVAMAEGSDAARSASDLVLLDNNLASMVDAVYEGRRVINNLERVASLFLVKTVYSSLLSFFYIFLPFVYPLVPIQNTLISTLTIGIPSFILALKPNRERVKGSFLRNVLSQSVPGGLAAAIMIILSQVACYLLQLSYIQSSTIAVLILGFVGLLVLFQVSHPMDVGRRILFIACTAGFLAGVIFLPDLFFLAGILQPIFWVYLPFLFLTAWIFAAFRNYGKIRVEQRQKKQANRVKRTKRVRLRNKLRTRPKEQ